MALRTLEELNRDFEIKKRKPLIAVSDLLLFLAVLMLIIAIITTGFYGGKPKSILGYSYYTVLTSSMQDEIPKGAFTIVKRTDTQRFKMGDNITYTTDRGMTVTHKIVGIQENYGDSGARGFQTQGVNNANPDPDIVDAADVVGKVVFVLPVMGAVLSGFINNVFPAFILFGLCVLLSFCLRILHKKPARRRSRARWKNTEAIAE